MIPNPRSEKQDPESIVLDILSSKPRINSKETYKLFISKYKEGMSIQGFYKMLRQLMENRVVVKEDGLLSLDISWIQDLVNFTERVKLTFLSSETIHSPLLILEGETKAYDFGNVIEMDNFWDHAIFVIANYYQKNPQKDNNAYSKNFYSWLQVLRTHDNISILNSFDQLNMDWYMASGSKTMLNSFVPKILNDPRYHFKIYKKHTGYKEGENNFHVTVVGDFIFETKLPPHLFHVVKNMFETVNNLSDFDPKPIQKTLSEPTKVTLNVSRDKKRAEKIRKEIKSLVKRKRK